MHGVDVPAHGGGGGAAEVAVVAAEALHLGVHRAHVAHQRAAEQRRELAVRLGAAVLDLLG